MRALQATVLIALVAPLVLAAPISHADAAGDQSSGRYGLVGACEDASTDVVAFEHERVGDSLVVTLRVVDLGAAPSCASLLGPGRVLWRDGRSWTVEFERGDGDQKEFRMTAWEYRGGDIHGTTWVGVARAVDTAGTVAVGDDRITWTVPLAGTIDRPSGPLHYDHRGATWASVHVRTSSDVEEETWPLGIDVTDEMAVQGVAT